MKNKRDEAIINHLEQFKAMTREQIMFLHFNHLKYKVNDCNRVLLRLLRTKKINVSKEKRMYIYFPEKSIKKDSAKLTHYLKIVDLYIELKQTQALAKFTVEPKLDEKGTIEPDVLIIFHKTLFFVELQNSHYSEKQWQDKIKKYEAYYLSEKWKTLSWQHNKPIFPMLWIVGKNKHAVKSDILKIHQMNVSEMHRFILDKIKKES